MHVLPKVVYEILPPERAPNNPQRRQNVQMRHVRQKLPETLVAKPTQKDPRNRQEVKKNAVPLQHLRKEFPVLERGETSPPHPYRWIDKIVLPDSYMNDFR